MYAPIRSGRLHAAKHILGFIGSNSISLHTLSNVGRKFVKKPEIKQLGVPVYFFPVHGYNIIIIISVIKTLMEFEMYKY